MIFEMRIFTIQLIFLEDSTSNNISRSIIKFGMKAKQTDYIIIPSFWLEQLEGLKTRKPAKKSNSKVPVSDIGQVSSN